MVRRSLGVALWSIVGLLACFLGALSSLVGTGAGRQLLARVAEGSLGHVFTGQVEIGDVSGSLLTGITLSQVRLFDADTTLVAWLPRAELAYNPLDFAAGRVALFEFVLRQPVINIVQHPNGRLNIEELLRLGGPPPDTGSRGPATLIVFRNVRIEDGSVTLRLQARTPEPGDTALEIAHGGPDGRLRIRRFEHLDARLPVLQISSPRERGIRIDIMRLAVESSDPAVRLVDVAGRLRVLGDTLDVDLRRVRLPGSALQAARGQVSWPRDTLLFNLTLRADSATLRDVRFIDSQFAGRPGGAVLAGGVRLRSHGGRRLEVGLDPLRLDDAGGRVTGRLTALTVADSGIVALRDADLTAQDFDLEFARGFLDTLPFAGRLSGHTGASGRLRSLTLDVDWVFRDSLVPGWPETRIRGQGEVDLLAAEGMLFQPFTVEAAAVDLGTVQRLVPAVTLRGQLYAAGTLRGPLTNAHFAGTLEHRDGERPPSRVSGSMRLDSRTDTLGIDADVAADSLSFDGLSGSFPALLLRGAVAGPVKLSGTLAALETHAELRSAGGTVTGDGVLLLGLPSYGARDFTLRARDLDLARWLHRGPPSRLTFTVRGAVAGDSATPPVGALEATLAPSLFAGTPLDSGVARVRFADRRLYVDSLRLAQPGLITSGSGSLGWSRGTRGVLALDFDADSLNSLDSLVSWLAGREGGGGRGGAAAGEHGGGIERPLAGSARVLLTLEGSLDSLALEARASVTRLKWRDWEVLEGRVRGAYRPGPVPAFQLEATVDSVTRDALGFGTVVLAAQGSRDSLAWFSRARVGEGAGFLAGGRFARRSDSLSGVTTVALDSLALQLPGDVWVLERPTALTVDDSAARVSRLVLHSAYGSGSLVLEGDLPHRGRANAHVQLEGFPVVGVYALLERDTMGVAGTITATAALAGTRADPVARGAFSLTNGSFGAFRTPFVDGTVEYRAQRLDAGLHLWRSGQQILNVQAHLPLDLSLLPVAQRQLPDTLSVRATADSVDLSVLEAVTPALERVVGVFSADLGIAGSWDTPRLRGALEIGGAAATIPALNVRYEDIAGRLVLSGDTIAIRSLSARSGNGRADVGGVVRLEQLTRPVLDLRIAADQFQALDLRNTVSITASGQLTLGGPVLGATLTGRVKVPSGVLYFADLVQKRIVDLDELVDTSLASIIAQQRLGPEFQNVFLDSLRIDQLELEMGSDVWLRSNEANIQLAGTVHLTKQRNLYLVSGTLQAVRGTYRLRIGPITREFVVTQGTVRYFGTPDQDAALDIEAKHVVHPVPTPTQRSPEDITVVAHITGTLLVPRVTLRAEGLDLAQTEVISYVLFGKSSVDLAGEQGGIADRSALLQSALSVLSGEIEQTIVSGGVPVDYLEIRPAIRAASGPRGDAVLGWQLAVGRQLGPKTFLVLNAGFCEGRELALRKMLGLSVQFRISPEWRTEASFEPAQTCTDPGSETQQTLVPRQVGLDLFWEKRY
ncbi:MAG TPA: translocation/assembly module TamB domain-containing protein [Gemmatimonadales bacterium]|nr:translocation/assembly module TamB domain-containing protein [Gemmatimonadales bacterium]